jgi:S-adenosylmethionine hydrolase
VTPRPAETRRPRLVTLTTDLGWAYAAQMKAVLYRSLPPGTVVDLAHDLPPHAIAEAAFVLKHMASGFPAGTVHVAIIDPGVGSSRAPIAIDCRDGSRLVGPDNGVLGPLAASLGIRGAVRLDPGRLGARRRPSVTFDGRDLFAPAAARLAGGAAPGTLGSALTPKPLALPRPARKADGASGQLVHIDRFGNLITNVPTPWMPAGRRRATVTLSRMAARTARLVRTYADLAPEELGVLGSSFGLLEIALREASAGERLGANVGDRVLLRWLPPGARGSGKR